MILTMNTRSKTAAAALVLAALVRSAAAESPDAEAYARVLDETVTAQGMVRYADLAADFADLDRYLAGLAAVTSAELAALPEAERIAFWLNAYNAITLKTIIDNYPIRGRGLSALRYPSSSIRQISGAWSSREWTVAGRKMSLDDIEHETLRKQFSEPRVHMALVCAAFGCPPLRDEPYDGARLDEQLDEQARRYLASPAGLQAEPDRGRVGVSSIFKWFDDDFETVGGMRAFVSRYAPAGVRELVGDPKTRIVFLDYDWSLNEAQGD